MTVTASRVLATALSLAVVGGVALGGVATTGTMALATTTAVPLTIPVPTGPHPVGTTSLHLIDQSRPDPFAPTPRSRELMVRLWYPAAPSHRPPAPYLPAPVSAVLVAQINALAGTSLPEDSLTFPANARQDAPAALRRRPIVLFSPGAGTNVAFYTGLIEELASRGYVVAGIDHTFDAVVQFPDGRMELPAGELPFAESLAVRIADVRFVLDRLAAVAAGRNPDAGHRTPPRGLGRALDVRRVAAVGHSMGSMTSIGVIDQDRRIDAGAALDGNPLGPASLDRPFLMMGNPSHRRDADPDWAGFFDRLRGPRLHVVIDGIGHLDLTDITVFKRGIDLPPVFEVGPIDGLRALHVQRSYLTAWLDRGLLGRRRPLLLAESPAFPEVDFQP
jgi:hypothetical protein